MKLYKQTEIKLLNVEKTIDSDKENQFPIIVSKTSEGFMIVTSRDQKRVSDTSIFLDLGLNLEESKKLLIKNEVSFKEEKEHTFLLRISEFHDKSDFLRELGKLEKEGIKKSAAISWLLGRSWRPFRTISNLLEKDCSKFPEFSDMKLGLYLWDISKDKFSGLNNLPWWPLILYSVIKNKKLYSLSRKKDDEILVLLEKFIQDLPRKTALRLQTTPGIKKYCEKCGNIHTISSRKQEVSKLWKREFKKFLKKK